MNQILAAHSVSISELKRNPTAILEQAEGLPVAVLNHNKPAAYLLAAETYEKLMELLDDYQLTQLITARQHEKSQAIEVSIDDL